MFAPLFEMCRYFDYLDDLLKTAMAATTAAGDTRGLSVVSYRMAVNHASRGRHEDAAELLERARAGFDEAEDQHSSSIMLALSGMIHRFQGNSDKALICYNEALPVLHAVDDMGGVAWTLRGVG